MRDEELVNEYVHWMYHDLYSINNTIGTIKNCSDNPSSECNIYLWGQILIFDNNCTTIMQGYATFEWHCTRLLQGYATCNYTAL